MEDRNKKDNWEEAQGSERDGEIVRDKVKYYALK